MTESGTGSRDIPIVWGNVPQRNKNFTGREGLLDQLRRQLAEQKQTAVLPYAIHGLGGVGKTQLAVEYAHRNGNQYQIVWWISADQVPLVRSTMAALAPRLGLSDIASGRVEDAVSGVLDALRRGVPYSRWLLIFDNADQPEEIRDLLPQGQPHGHVLVTSRNHRWNSVADTVEVDVFAREESLEFLHRRVPGITDKDAYQLAEELGDLPLALEQAGALQVETGISVTDYLLLLEKAAGKLLAENSPTDYPVPVAAAWSISVEHVARQAPFALELLRRCAFFGPEPIPRELLTRGARVLPSPIGDQLQDPLLVGRGIRELGRYALARIDNNRRTIQVHRLIQKLIRDELTKAQADEFRHEVHLLLAERDPDTPEQISSWARYQELFVHLQPSAAVESSDSKVRRLVRNVVVYLYETGDYQSANSLIDQALDRWRQESGVDHPDVLLLQGQKADILFGLGRYEEAYNLRRPTLERMRSVLGHDNEQTLIVTNGHGADLRARGEFQAALELDEDSLARHLDVFGEDHERTLRARNNLTVDNELTGRYKAAYELGELNYQETVDFFGVDDYPLVILALSGISRVLRQQGRYVEALERGRLAYSRYERVVADKTLQKDHPWVLAQYRDLSIAQRLAGEVETALELAREAYERYQASAAFSGDHPEALAAGINFGNALRLAASLELPGGDLAEAVDLLDQTVERYRSRWTADHPYAHAGTINLAVAQFALGEYTAARDLLEEAREGLERRVGADHHYTLVCVTNLATALAELGDAEGARKLGAEVVPKLSALLSDQHPHTLGASLNLNLDQATTGVESEASEARLDLIAQFQAVLGPDHYDVETARRGGRVSSVIEPPPV